MNLDLSGEQQPLTRWLSSSSKGKKGVKKENRLPNQSSSSKKQRRPRDAEDDVGTDEPPAKKLKDADGRPRARVPTSTPAPSRNVARPTSNFQSGASSRASSSTVLTPVSSVAKRDSGSVRAKSLRKHPAPSGHGALPTPPASSHPKARSPPRVASVTARLSPPPERVVPLQTPHNPLVTPGATVQRPRPRPKWLTKRNDALDATSGDRPDDENPFVNTPASQSSSLQKSSSSNTGKAQRDHQSTPVFKIPDLRPSTPHSSRIDSNSPSAPARNLVSSSPVQVLGSPSSRVHGPLCSSPIQDDHISSPSFKRRVRTQRGKEIVPSSQSQYLAPNSSPPAGPSSQLPVSHDDHAIVGTSQSQERELRMSQGSSQLIGSRVADIVQAPFEASEPSKDYSSDPAIEYSAPRWHSVSPIADRHSFAIESRTPPEKHASPSDRRSHNAERVPSSCSPERRPETSLLLKNGGSARLGSSSRNSRASSQATPSRRRRRHDRADSSPSSLARSGATRPGDADDSATESESDTEILNFSERLKQQNKPASTTPRSDVGDKSSDDALADDYAGTSYRTVFSNFSDDEVVRAGAALSIPPNFSLGGSQSGMDDQGASLPEGLRGFLDMFTDGSFPESFPDSLK
ncbi:hypothetical protein PLICRDRAFT_694006 [Plicaturopsis crispa FD-325 SS-3]|nr:hypothetical protein PLICRDRAFT_694006 [Plicaturopsis crispa FD-325 SS-3]